AAEWQAGDGKAISRQVHDLVTQWKGSISAEHGIGQLKRDESERSGDPPSFPPDPRPARAFSRKFFRRDLMASAPQANLPLFYNDSMPLNSRDHATWHARGANAAPWSIDQHAVPSTVEEFPQAARHFPIVFSSGDNPVPSASMGTAAIMYVVGFSSDNSSSMASTIAVGFVVDDAIVMSENIYRHVEAGMSPMEAAYKGAGEIGFTIVSISVSSVAVFIPSSSMGGIVGRVFREFAVTISVAIIVSGFVS
ncbi:hypothetical protein OY671_008238, partial [Metschnikowia pulcherrima]